MSDKNQSGFASQASGALALADGTVFLGNGTGAAGIAIGELCFNTAMTGYQEILTDPSYAQQVVLFTFPHIGNVGANAADHEESSDNATRAAVGTVFRDPITPPSSWRAEESFDAWLSGKGIVGLSGVDTRALTRLIREKGMQKCAIQFAADGNIDTVALVQAAQAWEGLETADLAANVASDADFDHRERLWQLSTGFVEAATSEKHVVIIDFGVKKNILRNL